MRSAGQLQHLQGTLARPLAPPGVRRGAGVLLPRDAQVAPKSAWGGRTRQHVTQSGSPCFWWEQGEGRGVCRGQAQREPGRRGKLIPWGLAAALLAS